METKETTLFGTAKVSFLSLDNGIDLFIVFLYRYHHQVLERNPVVTESNKKLIVETFRSIAEILIWGDQNDSSVFEYIQFIIL